MTLAEFKAWFEGFTESIEGKAAPTQKQWARIKAKVADINGTAVTQTIYLDRYVNPYRPYWDRYWSIAGSATWGGSVGTSSYSLSATAGATGQSFNATEAMYALGRAEASMN